ncbi:MAG: hypothetical protein V7785_16980 [Bermanella sp.]
MKASKSTVVEQSLHVDAVSEDGISVVKLKGRQISPRGISANCFTDNIALLHNSETGEGRAKFQTLLLSIELGFSNGEVVQLETSAQIQSIRRVSQQEFEINMYFINMMQDGYRHIARYIVDFGSRCTE